MSGIEQETEQIYENIKDFISLTPLELSVPLSDKGDAKVYLKVGFEGAEGETLGFNVF